MKLGPIQNGWAFLGVTMFVVLLPLGASFAENRAGAIDDQDCRGSQRQGPHDEPDPNACHEECVDGHFWFKWGHFQWCYYDDGPE